MDFSLHCTFTEKGLSGCDAQPPSSPPLFRPGEIAISLTGNHTWDTGVDPSLKDMDMHILAGQLVAIVGSTGSGQVVHPGQPAGPDATGRACTTKGPVKVSLGGHTWVYEGPLGCL